MWNGKQHGRKQRRVTTFGVGDVVRVMVSLSRPGGIAPVAKCRPVIILEVRPTSVVVLPLSTRFRAGRRLRVWLPGAERPATAFHRLVEISQRELPAHRLDTVDADDLEQIDRLLAAGTIDRSHVDRPRRARRPERRHEIVDRSHLIPEPDRIVAADDALRRCDDLRRQRVEDLDLGA